MDLAAQLLGELSRRNADYLALYIGDDQYKFRELMEFVFQGKEPLSFRAAWVATLIADKHKNWCVPYLEPIILNLEKFEHTGTSRSLLRMMSDMVIPEILQGRLYDICYRWLLDRHTAVAVKVYCMQIMYNISVAEPDLRHELRILLDELTDDESPGIRSRSRQLMRKL